MATEKQYVQLNYTRNFTFNDNYELVANGETRNFGWGLGTVGKYFELQGQFDYEARKLALQSFGYAIIVHPPGKCWAILFKQTQVVGGDPSINGSINFNFGGEAPVKATM
jgi:hypothetical protein